MRMQLDPADQREMFRIRRELLGWHHATGATQAGLARSIGRSENFIYKLEGGLTSYKLSSLQLWASCFDLRVQPVIDTPEGGFQPNLNVVSQANIFYQSSRPFEAVGFVRLWTVAELSLRRQELGISTKQLGEFLHVTQGSVAAWEREGHDPMVAKLFCYARGLGGSIRFDLVERQDWVQ